MNIRDNALCPQCGSLERHRLLWLYIQTKINEEFCESNIELIHFAPEKFMYDFLSNEKNVNYYPCDLFPDVYPFGEVNRIDITKIALEPARFDVVLCNHVFEHVPYDKRAMSELYRIMKKNAWGIVQVPIDLKREITFEDENIKSPQDREKYFGQSDHVRIYGRDYTERLESAGFHVNMYDFVSNYSDEEIQKFGLDRDEVLFIITK